MFIGSGPRFANPQYSWVPGLAEQARNVSQTAPAAIAVFYLFRASLRYGTIQRLAFIERLIRLPVIIVTGWLDEEPILIGCAKDVVERPVVEDSLIRA